MEKMATILKIDLRLAGNNNKSRFKAKMEGP